MKRVYLSVLALIAVLFLLYYLGPLQSTVTNYPMLSGIIIGMIISFIPSAWTGHFGNRITEERNKKSHEAKQKTFMEKLSSEARHYITSPNIPDSEAEDRQRDIAEKVKKLSLEIFGEECPPIESARPEETEYQDIHCKWCQRPHKAFSGSRGKCTRCCLPLDLWIGSQGETHHS